MGFIRARRARLAGLATVGTLAAAGALLINPTVASATASRPAVSFPGSVPAWATASADRGTANAKDIVEGDQFSEHLFSFPGKRGDYFKGLYWTAAAYG